MAADSAVVPVTAVAPEEVRFEVASLFGRPGGGAAATWEIDVASYAEHERVQYWMGFYTGRARWHFTRYLERLGRYDSMIRGRLAAAGLPQDLIYLAMIESGFNQIVRSRAGAVGLWQFIPGTARRYGLTVDAWVDERRDPYLATDAAVRFLAELSDRFGSVYLAAAAYNSGPRKIERGLRHGDYGALNGDEAYFAMAEGSFLRRETRDYVPKLIAAALLAKEPARYGFTDLVPWSPLRYDSVEVPYAVGLDVLARLAGTGPAAMEEMNPRYFRGVTPPERGAWVRVPVGSADSVAARLAVLPARDRVTVVVHVVERGETLWRIARRYGVTVEDIKLANQLRSTRLARGQRLVVPTSRSRTWQRVTVRDPSDRPTRRARGTSRRVHIVQPGESPWTIANRFGVPLSSLLEANRLTRRSVIRPGQAVRIPN
jgi:membrane-bound lytic murein transglycosylase D